MIPVCLSLTSRQDHPVGLAQPCNLLNTCSVMSASEVDQRHICNCNRNVQYRGVALQIVESCLISIFTETDKFSSANFPSPVVL